MQLFHCAHCQNLVYFENHQCVSCGHALAYLPDHRLMASLEEPEAGSAERTTPAAPGQKYRLCANYTKNQICNWAVPAESPNELCDACRLTRVIPDLSLPQWHQDWYQLEVAKRRLVYEVTELGLPMVPKGEEAANGLTFEFLADPLDPNEPHVLTGHDDGVITIALVEADDAEREKRRLQLHEPFRTLLGHFRHEVGHYYWDRLIRDGGRLEEFRTKFGDERPDYATALQQYYAMGAPVTWSENFISAYASSHPWEDWAETWAHYLHMVDALETADAAGVRVAPPVDLPVGGDLFAAKLKRWHAVTHMLNNLNRSLGLRDAYPFVLSTPVIEKMRFVDQVIAEVKPVRAPQPLVVAV
jgi:hypothetical protein